MKEDLERTPLRTILTNFLNHIDTLENQRTHNTYESEFQELKLFSETIKGTKQFSCSEGEKEVNRKKNRYKDILPFNVSRVVLNEYAGVPGSDYINANYIKGASGSPAYIASQGPLPHTVNDFWRMVVQCEVQVIIMACNEEEAGKHKCENYWVEGEGEEKQFGMVTLRLLKASTVCPDFSVRTMRLKYTNTHSNTEERTVCQFHYSTWPDHGVPPLVRPLLDMVRLVRDTQASETLPVLIHCSAGCGRTGTICAIDYVWGLLRAGKLTTDFSLLSLVREMRRQRIAMVQTKEQYILVHQAVRELFKEQLRMIDSHPYENIDYNGLPLIKCSSPEPTYDSITSYKNNKTEEKQDEKEKETAPPLPQKKKLHILSSKQAKEVENLSERQRLVEQGGSSSESVVSTSSSSHRPRIATLRSLFERDSRQVARSHSLGSFRPPVTNMPSPVEVKEFPAQQPIPSRGILKVPLRPALPVKRSKSLRVLGSEDRCKLTIPPPLTAQLDMPRRLSLESNYDDLLQNKSGDQPLSDYLSVDSVVAGLGVRERRNSFRQAVHRESQQPLTDLPKKPSLLRSYTSVDMRYARDKSNMIVENTVIKPILKPKPNLKVKPINKILAATKTTSGARHQKTNQQHLSSMLSNCYESNRSRGNASSARTLANQSMSLRIAQKPKREDCQVLTTIVPRAGTSQQLESIYSSGDSISCSSDKSSQNSKSLSDSVKYNSPTNLQMYNSTRECVDSSRKEKQTSQSTQMKNMLSSRSFHISPKSVSHHKKLEKSPQPCGADYCGRIKPQHDLRKQPPPPSTRPVVYDSQNVRQHSTNCYGSVPKVPPPPYVEPGKNAQKLRSNAKSVNDVYSKSQDQRHWQMATSSRDMMLLPHSLANKQNLTSPADAINVERRHIDPDYRLSSCDMLVNKAEGQTLTVNEAKYLELQRKNLETDIVQNPREIVLTNSVDVRHSEQMHRSNDLDPYSKTFHEKRVLAQDQLSKAFIDRGKLDLKTQQDYRNVGEKVTMGHEKSRSSRDSAAKLVDRRQLKDNFHTSTSISQRTVGNESVNLQGHYQTLAEIKPNYHPRSEELYPKFNLSGKKLANQYLQQTQDHKMSYLSQTPRPHPQGNWPPSKELHVGHESENTINQEVKMRRGSQDDLALCATTPSRVKRHASVVMLRHSLIEGGNVAHTDSTASPLSVWNQTSNPSGLESTTNHNTPNQHEDPWSGAVGVDLDQVAASMNTKKDGKMMRAALEALHLRKASQVATKTNHLALKPSHLSTKVNQPFTKSSHVTPKLNQSKTNYSADSSKNLGTPPQFKPPPDAPKPPGPFRKQQQYL